MFKLLAILFFLSVSQAECQETYGERARGWWHDFTHKVEEVWHNFTDKIKSWTHKSEDKARELGHDIKHEAEEIKAKL